MNANPFFTPWIICPKPNPQASLRLFCFPYAGGKATIYRTWASSLPKNVEVCAIELPGRGTRLMETPFTQLSLLTEAIAEAIFPYLHKPFAFFGHSMGALINFELARLLGKKYGLSPVHLFVSGRGAPHVPYEVSPIHALPTAAFIEELRRLNGTPEAVLENVELMQLLLPMLRADFTIIDSYVYVPEPPLDCPITAFSGLQDRRGTCERLEAWREQTSADFSLHMFPGDHFFLHSAEPLLLQTLSRKLHHLTNKLTSWQCAS
jgi:medium-chain acyl-[acyl-carrier-protein] hydrolase